jgi:hypothetical protein
MKKRIKEDPILWIPIWIALGAGIGVPFDNIPIGVGFGTCIGFILFLIFNFKINKKIS